MPMPSADREAARARFLKRLALVADEMQPDFVRMAAIRAVKQILSTTHPYQTRTAQDLLDNVKRTWDTRTFLEGGRGTERRVLRPPQSLADLW